MLDILVRYRDLIGTAVFVAAAIATFASVSWRWYLALPLAFAVGLVATVLWGVFLGVLERSRYRL